MAELHVHRKRGSLTWLWIVLIVIIAAAGFYYYKHINDPRNYPLPTKTGVVTKSFQNNKI